MKKILALMLAVVLTLSLGAVAFADEVEAPNTTTGTTDVENDEDTAYDLGFGDLGKPEGSEPDKPWRHLLLYHHGQRRGNRR